MFHALHFTELYEEEYLQSLIQKIHSFGFTLEHYLIADGILVEAFDDNGKVHRFHTLREIVEFLRDNGRKGIEIQRYKGLG